MSSRYQGRALCDVSSRLGGGGGGGGGACGMMQSWAGGETAQMHSWLKNAGDCCGGIAVKPIPIFHLPEGPDIEAIQPGDQWCC